MPDRDGYREEGGDSGESGRSHTEGSWDWVVGAIGGRDQRRGG